MNRTFGWSIIILVALLALSCVAPQVVAVMFQLIVGWPVYLARVIPNVRVNWAGVATAAACLLAVVLLGHHVARWLWRATPIEDSGAAPGPPWQMRWTLAAVALVVLMFVAGIGATGVGHQTVWLARREQPMFEYRSRESANRVKCASNLKQIHLALMLYAQANDGRLPVYLGELLLHTDTTGAVFVCPSSNDENAPGATPHEQAAALQLGRHCSYVYHGRGLTWPQPDDVPIACEPLMNHDGGMNVIFGDGRVQFCSAAEAEQVLRRLRAGPVAGTAGR